MRSGGGACPQAGRRHRRPGGHGEGAYGSHVQPGDFVIFSLAPGPGAPPQILLDAETTRLRAVRGGFKVDDNPGAADFSPVPDRDFDGIDDPTEDSRGLNPLRPDTDADGIPDAWQVFALCCHNPAVPDSNVDYDLDGATGMAELAPGQRPLRP